LAKTHLVRRARDPIDGRGVVIHLTEQGLETASAARREYRRRQPRMLGDEFTEREWTTFARLLQRAEVLVGASEP